MEEKMNQKTKIVVRPAERMLPSADVGGVPSHEAIALRAYEKFCSRGCRDGLAEQDWLAAEQELQEIQRKTMARA